MLKASTRARDVVHQILAFSRQADQEHRPVDLSSVVVEALRLLRATMPTTIELRTDLADDVGAVLVDPTRVHQVLINLSTNAAHAMRETGGVLEVGLANVDLARREPELDLPPGPYVQLTVSDTGHGIPDELVERIFEPYFTTKDKGVGTGLGLSVAHGIIKKHGGGIKVTSALGRGTTFTVLLPRIAASPLELPETEPGQRHGTERVLLVDDEPAIIDLVEPSCRFMPKSTRFITICAWPCGCIAPPMSPKAIQGSPSRVRKAGMMVWKGRLPGS